MVSIGWLLLKASPLGQQSAVAGLRHHQLRLVVGIGHAGTLISAIYVVQAGLADLDQPFCRGVTLFAVACALCSR